MLQDAGRGGQDVVGRLTDENDAVDIARLDAKPCQESPCGRFGQIDGRLALGYDANRFDSRHALFGRRSSFVGNLPNRFGNDGVDYR